jgi:hypothetical protein
MGESEAVTEYIETEVTIVDSDTGSDDDSDDAGSDGGTSSDGDNGDNGGDIKFPMGPDSVRR